MAEWESTIQVIGLDDLTESMQKLVKRYPDRAGDLLRSEALKTRKEIAKNAKSSFKVDNKRKKMLSRVGSYRVSQVKGYGVNQYVEISARSPHFHLLERGHAVVTPKHRTIKKKGIRFTLKSGGRTVGNKSGYFFLKKAKDEEAIRFPEAVDDMVNAILKESGLW